MKKGQLGPMVGGARAIYDVLPPVPTGAAAPTEIPLPTSTTAPVQPMLPPPPSAPIWAPMPGHIASLPSRTPGQIISEQKQQIADEEIRRKIARLQMSDLPEEYKMVGKAAALGVPGATGLEVAQINAANRQATQQEKFRQQLELRGKRVFYRVPGQTPGTSEVRNYRELGGITYNDDGTIADIPPNSVPVKEGYAHTVDAAGNVHVFNPQAAVGPGNWQAVIPGGGKPVQPRASSAAASPDDDALIEAIIQNPSIYATLTPTVISRISAKLAARGFNQFGKPMSEVSMRNLAQSQSAVGALRYLKNVIKENEDKLGPITGWWGTLNPWSEARKVQADINRVKQETGKALEGGVLRKEDEIKYKRILATLFDTPSTAQYKLDGVIRDIERDIGEYQKSLGMGGRALDLSKPGQPESQDQIKARLKQKYGAR
jgi:hypothetical protein